jgi:DNA recombination protein RmuC
LQAQQLESFAQQLARLTNSNEQRFESLRLALEARLAAMQATMRQQAGRDAPNGR